ncbi:hypothetical protein METBIDRAFT_93459 [Metschnikowia bicuspidata var. bicuspidata NRRL YB-4993]|uniref:Uncharacterized protein n=1 Tax=Metschnikowia bicuspidata var. bicuspidata NRRL YB-4993 TaxID=869754 RepID=A0A1A0HFB9_9ASCO|nr:hypothetical protein METBIDRAFT_93459 [Metschnikowia bicuspidata var. bicuspidata NRRL YB-4993]OBA22839.1 hypothetical protein METBIDRAFT_93459 [Metschnikowia bicuspidata var. bicuspidata NRRL YB-4993]
MNVSRNAYYTSEYLKDQRYGQEKVLKIQPGAVPSHVAPPDLTRCRQQSTQPKFPWPETQAQFANRAKPRKGHDDLDSQMTPAQLNHIALKTKQRRDSRSLVDYQDYYSSRHARGTRNVPQSTGTVKHGNTMLFLNNAAETENRNMAEYPYNAYDGAFFEGDDTSLYANHGRFSAPIDLQKQHGRAKSIKPNLTQERPTDVYNAGKNGRSSPMDVVFEDPSKRDLTKKQKVTQAFRQMKTKLGRTEYAHYDYSQGMAHDEPESLVVRSEYGDPELDELSPEPGDQFRDQGESGLALRPHAKENNDSDDWRSSFSGVKETIHGEWKRLQASLASDVPRNGGEGPNGRFTHGHSEDGPHVLCENAAPRIPEDTNGFNPLWSYMLSWLVYQSCDGAADTSEGKISEIRDEDENTTSAPARQLEPYRSTGGEAKNPGERRLKRVGKKYRGILLKWNQPALSRKNMVKTTAHGMVNRDHRLDVAESGVDAETVPSHECEAYESDLPGSPMATAQLHEGSPTVIISNINKLIKNIKIMRILFAPIDVVAENFPRLQTFVIFIELFIFMWILYELSLLIDALCMAVKAVCAPMIAVGKFMNRIV